MANIVKYIVLVVALCFVAVHYCERNIIGMDVRLTHKIPLHHIQYP